ncbi:MAG: hypothetical protein IPL22_10775 [Bacteroidetes bacterium]|nr:hypothetical protein [Bacteroidota bacterium]
MPVNSSTFNSTSYNIKHLKGVFAIKEISVPLVNANEIECGYVQSSGKQNKLQCTTKFRSGGNGTMFLTVPPSQVIVEETFNGSIIGFWWYRNICTCTTPNKLK